MNNDNLASKLDRFKNLIGSQPKNNTPPKTPSRYLKMANALGGNLCFEPDGTFCLVTRQYDRDYCHGNFRLDQLSLSKIPLAAFSATDQPGEADIRSLVFLDTETTGLGGAGAVAFLIGCGSFVGESFEVRQYVIPDYGDETAMLEALQLEFGKDKTLVTYNGKAFDIPLVQDRMIINRVGRQVIIDEHIDLLHATRRLFKRRLADCSLTNIERNLLDFHRHDDIPGYLIPSVYFDWLGQENLDIMKQVLEHNRLDIVSLAFLVQQIAEAFKSDGETLDSADDRHSLAKIYGRRKQSDKVAQMFARDGSDSPIPDDMALFHADNFKRSGNLDKAMELWQSLSFKTNRQAYQANIELAKQFEHRIKDINQALCYSIKAYNNIPDSAFQKRALDHRISRLRRKLAPDH